MSRFFIASALLLGAAGAAQAHITLEQPSAEAGTYYKAVLRVGHGCDGSPTQAITVTLPPGVEHAHPMPKPGWSLASADATQATWRGALADAHYDEFVLRLKLPAQAGPCRFACISSASAAPSTGPSSPPAAPTRAASSAPPRCWM